WRDLARASLARFAEVQLDCPLEVAEARERTRRAWRALAREITGAFAEVQLVCPPEISLARERAVRWGTPTCPHRGGGVPDVVVEYEYSLSPDLLLDTATRSEWAAGEDLLRLARRLLR
ncbi:MAG TPA: hypothetical protein VGD07_02280, partial [Methylomirabilota bacterium]